MPKKWTFLRKDETTGKKYFALRTVKPPTLVESSTKDEVPPLGLEGTNLTKEKPAQPISLGGRERGGAIFTHAQASAEAMEAAEERLEEISQEQEQDESPESEV